MKKIFLVTTLAVGVLFSAIGANAEENYVEKFNCSNDQGQTIVVSHLVTYGNVAKVVFSDGTNEKTFKAGYTFDLSDPSLQKWTYQLTDQGSVASGELQIASQTVESSPSHFCRGRAPCGEPQILIETRALLKQGENETDFNCQ